MGTRVSLVLVAALLSSVNGRAQPQPARAQVGPLQAWVARGASGACQLQLHNAGEKTVVAWSVSVRSTEARHTSIVEHDGWRDEFHLPSAVLHVPPQETRVFTVAEEGALGHLRVEIHLVVRADGQAHGMAEWSSHVAPAARVLARMLDRRRQTALEALGLAEKADAAIGLQGAAQVLASKFVSTMLETDGDWNWWRITEGAKAAEAMPAGDPKAFADLSAAIDLLREAHRRGTDVVTLTPAEPMHPVAVGTCTS